MIVIIFALFLSCLTRLHWNQSIRQASSIYLPYFFTMKFYHPTTQEYPYKYSYLHAYSIARNFTRSKALTRDNFLIRCSAFKQKELSLTIEDKALEELVVSK